nr:uncharacterized protein LOC109172171 [Ipomoea batatas]
MAEVLACREAVSWLKRHGIMEAQVESDCSGAINSLSRRTLDLSYVWHIVNHCYSLSPKGVSDSFVNITFRHIRKTMSLVSRALEFLGQWALMLTLVHERVPLLISFSC